MSAYSSFVLQHQSLGRARLVISPALRHSCICGTTHAAAFSKDGKSSLKIEFLGRRFLGHHGPRRQDISDPRIRVGAARDLGARLWHLDKLDTRKLWADFSLPTFSHTSHGGCIKLHLDQDMCVLVALSQLELLDVIASSPRR